MAAVARRWAAVALLLLAAVAVPPATAKIVKFDNNDAATHYLHRHTEVLLGCGDDCREGANPADPKNRPMIRFEGAARPGVRPAWSHSLTRRALRHPPAPRPAY